MRHSDFKIGTEFYTAAGKWRCTDIGTRVIVAISLESPRKFETNSKDGLHVTYSNDPSDLTGPPYMINEVVFDEYDFEGCYPTESGLDS